MVAPNEDMSIIQDVKHWFGMNSETVHVFTCEECTHRFSKTEKSLEGEDPACPTCGSSDVSKAI